MKRHRDLSQKQEQILLEVRAQEPSRLDQFLGSALNWKSRTRIQELIHKKRVRVNGEYSKPSRRVRRGDRVVLELAASAATPPDYDRLPLEILYEDAWLVAVNKPPHMLVHPTGTHVYDTLINYLHHRYQGRTEEGGGPVRPRLGHRIDRDTTGVVVIGKDTYVHNEVRVQFESRRVVKEYHALVEGVFPTDRVVDIPLGEGQDLESSLHHRVLKPSRTCVSVLERFEKATLVSCIPATGRQNQIRVHLAAVGHPLVGDTRFGGRPPSEGAPARYLLHSRSLRLLHPRLKCSMELIAPLPGDFEELLERLAAGA